MRALLALAAVVVYGLALRPPLPAQDTPMTREERIRQHRERIRKIILERREKQQEGTEQRTAPVRPAAPVPAPGAPGGAVGGPSTRPQTPSQGDEPPGAPNASDIKINNCILYLKPLDNIAVVGERFATRVILDNPAGKTVGKLSVLLRYDPRILSCVQVFDDQFSPYVVSPPFFEDNPVDGELVYEAQLKQPRVLGKTTVLTLIWEAVRPSSFSDIQFEFQDEGPTTAVTFNGQDVLGLGSDPYDGVINASVLVKKKETPAQTDLLSVNRKDAIAFFTGGDNPPGVIGLSLVKPTATIHVGDTFDVPIYFRNPDALALDTVSLFITFDPETLEVIDHDKGNWIRRGVNIFDGDRHDRFPFDYLVRNEALNGAGTIEYRVGLQRPRALPSGRLATIRFRALSPSPKTVVKFVVTGQGEKRTTSVTLHGEDLLDLHGDLSRPQIGLKILP